MSLNKLEDNLNFLVNGRRPQFFGKWKTTSIFLYIEDELKFLANGRQLHLFVNGRQLQTFNTGNTKTKTISTSGKAVLASPSLNWAWHSSAPACFQFIFSMLPPDFSNQPNSFGDISTQQHQNSCTYPLSIFMFQLVLFIKSFARQ